MFAQLAIHLEENKATCEKTSDVLHKCKKVKYTLL